MYIKLLMATEQEENRRTKEAILCNVIKTTRLLKLVIYWCQHIFK